MVRYVNINGQLVLVAPEAFESKEPVINCKDVICTNQLVGCGTCLFKNEGISLQADKLPIIKQPEEEYVKVLLVETSEHDGIWAYANKTLNEAKKYGVSCADIECDRVMDMSKCPSCVFSGKSLIYTHDLSKLTYVVVG